MALDQNRQTTNQHSSSPERESSDTNPNLPPTITLPKGGGAIRGIDEKFSANPVTGTGSMTVTIATSPGRSGFGPQLSLSYDSGAGNGPFGFGRSLSLPAITCKTDKGLPRHFYGGKDQPDSDVFILSGAEDLVPVLTKDTPGNWKMKDVSSPDGEYVIRRYQPRIEGLFARIERWTRSDGDVHWRSISKDNMLTLYGKDENSRIYDPDNSQHIFSWLICESYDDKGNVIIYDYKAEDSANVDLSQAQERNRTDLTRSANRYIKRIRYGNRTPRQGDEHFSQSTNMCFEVVFDYGEHDLAAPTPREDMVWPARPDAFSTYRAGFEVRTYRLCRRVLVFHNFPDETIGHDCLVRSTDFTYHEGPVASFIRSITQSGYSRREDSTYQKKSLPSLEFTYSQVHIDETIRTIDPESVENLPYGIDGSHYQWVDLDGEGIAGILTEQAGTWFYKRNGGNATFLPTEVLHTQPSLANLSGGRQQLLDFAGDGHISLTQFAGPVPGFYERTTGDGWEPFRAFPSLPAINWSDPNLRFVDLTGDGLADVLITDQDVFTWYPSRRKWGFGAGEYTPSSLDEERGPALVFADADQSIYLAPMSGDGLSDLVRIRNGEVCYWPNIGYGHFGAKVTLDNAPWFDAPDLFDQKRIRLADIDGSGTTDIIYLGRNEIKLFFNQSGNRLSDPHVLTESPRVDNLSSVNIVDLLGNGTACIVWSSPLPADARQPMHYIDLMGGQKPHLLLSVNNNMGAETRMKYAASTKFYNADRANGTPWVTRLPFPVYVVEYMETIDRVSNNRFVTRYAYHHGYYDGYEREFRGFGMGEQWVTVAIDVALQGAAGYTNLDASSFVPPIYTKTWIHTGAYLAEDRISRHFVHEYYKEDPLATLLPDTILPRGLSDEEQREACRSLKGSLLRQEVYADDGTSKSEHPYMVSEHNYTIVWMQPQGINRHAVFFTHARESIDYHYERVYEPKHDPRVSHQLVLEVDEFGNVRKSLAIGYGRRNSPLSQERDREKQTQTLVTYTDNRFTNPVLEQDAYRIPLLYETRTYELTGHGYSESYRPGLAEVIKDVAKAAFVEYQEQPDGSPQKRLIEHVRTLYRKNDLSAPLAAGKLESKALPYQSYKQAFTPALLTQVYEDRVMEEMLEEGGYVHSEQDDNWWIPSGRVFYAPDEHTSSAQELAFAHEHFFLPYRFEDPFGNTTVVAYDRYNLLATLSRDALNNEIRAEYDYRVLQPKIVIDPNHNRSEAAFDTLGMLAGTAIRGEVQDGQSESGDSLDGFVADLSGEQLRAFVRAPKEVAQQLLSSATTRIIYDLDRFKIDGQPVFAATLTRELHVNMSGGALSPVQVSFVYSDGFGREAQTKIQAEPGDAPLRTDNSANPEIPGTLVLQDGKPVLAHVHARWVGKGRTVYNDRGKPIKQYEPFFSSTHLYETEPEMVMTGVTPILFYDPMDRVIATLHPNHTYEKVVFDPWQQATWDVNDTMLQTDPAADTDVGDYFRRLPIADYLPTWYVQRIDGAMGRQEQAAAKKTAIHANTPTTAYFDTLGRTFLSVSFNRFERDEVFIEEKYLTRTNFDIEGNQRDVIDARERVVMRYDYDMLSNRIHQQSPDAGERWMLNDVTGKSVYAWNSRGHMLHTNYDALRRPIKVYLHEESGEVLLVGRTIYGEAQEHPERHNLRGKVYKGFDSAGLFTHERYDFKGNLQSSTRQLALDYKSTLNWSDEVALEGTNYNNTIDYDALSRPVNFTFPDKSAIKPIYNEANFIERIVTNLRGAQSATDFVSNIDYNARGQRILIEYGNGAKTRYDYDPQTFRLTKLQTARAADNKELQNLHYTFDPVGNITSIRDCAQATVYYDNQQVTASSTYRYDALYRLIEASGRELRGLAEGGIHPEWKPQYDVDDYARRSPANPHDLQQLQRYAEEYDYDEVGNILRLVHQASDGKWMRHYQYALDSNRMSGTSLPGDDRGSYSARYNYDAHGNIISMPHLPRMEWDYREQLQATQQQITAKGTPERTYYVYDATGQRLRKVTESFALEGETPRRVKESIYLGSFELYREYESDGQSVKLERETLHVMDDKQTIALVETKTLDSEEPESVLPDTLTRYQLSNHLGSTMLELDERAKIISYEEYYPYGSTSYQTGRSATEVSLKRYRYTGKERDEETGLYYYGVRYYAPWLGRWMSCDPAGMVEGTNVYVYVRNNPIALTDKKGLIGEGATLDAKTVLPQRGEEGYGAPFNQQPRNITINGEPALKEHLIPGATLEKVVKNYTTGQSDYRNQGPEYRRDYTYLNPVSKAANKTRVNTATTLSDNARTALVDRAQRAAAQGRGPGVSINVILEDSIEHAVESGTDRKVANRAGLNQVGNLFGTMRLSDVGGKIDAFYRSQGLLARAGRFLSNTAQNFPGLARAGSFASSLAAAGARSLARATLPLFGDAEDFLSQFGNPFSLATAGTALAVTKGIVTQGARTALASAGEALTSADVALATAPAASAAIVAASGIGGAVVGGFVGERVEAATGSRAAGVTAGTLSGAATGAAIGAAIGSIVPGVGTVAGAVIGGAAGAMGGFIKSYWK